MALKLNLGKLPWYSQVGLFVGLGLVAGALFWNYYAQPRQQEIADRQAQLDVLRAEIATGVATARRLPEFRSQVVQLEGQLDRLKTVLPEEKDVADLLRRIQGMATQSNLTIRGFTPQAVVTRQMHAEWPIGLELEGTYHNLGAFLERISKFPRIINVGSLKVVGKEKPGPGGATVVVHCTATTFVLLENAAAPAGQPASAAVPPVKAE